MLVTKKISSHKSIFNNCIVNCFKSANDLKYYDKLLLKINKKKLGIETFESIVYDVTKIEVEIKENRITKLTDHFNSKIYNIREDCIVTTNEKKLEKFGVLYDVRNLINNCDIRLNNSNNGIDITVCSYNRENIACYSIQNNEFENDKIKVEFNYSKELVCIYDKDSETYFYPLENKKVLLVEIDGKYTFREVYFNSEYNYDCLNPREPLDWDYVYFFDPDDFIFKYYPNSNKVFRFVSKRSGNVYYINPLCSEEIYKMSIKDYKEFVISNKIRNEENEICSHYKTIKNEIKEGLLKIVKSSYQCNEITKLKEYISEQLRLLAQVVKTGREKQELINEYKYELIVSAIDEIVDSKSKKVFKDNQNLIFKILEENINYFDDENE